jgi:putative tricarboxylic transport membrane protein
VGSFAHNNRLFDVYLMFTAGVVGYLFSKARVPLAPLVLGLILGPTLENNFRVAMMASTDLSLFLTRPVSLIFLVIAAISLVLVVLRRERQPEPERD